MSNKLQKRNEPIQGRVAAIISERELVINIGSSGGVREGMIFKVLAEQPLEILDPVTKEILDHLDQEKVRVKATEVKEKITTCRTYRVYTFKGGALADFMDRGGMASLFTPSRTETETLKAEDSSLPAPLSEEESYVKIGDRVVQLQGEDED
jgi:hypothetical protein